MTSPHIAIVGSRRFRDRSAVESLVDSLPPNATVVSGGCYGVDTWAVKRAEHRGLKTIVIEPDFTNFDSLSYHERCQRYYDRNLKVAKAVSSLHAFVANDRKGGTENTIGHAKERGIPVIIHD